jgi:hypothetical protein
VALKPIHKAEIGDLVRRTAYHESNQSERVFMILDIVGDYHGIATHTHCMTLKVYQVAGPPLPYSLNKRLGDVPMCMYEIV